MTKNKTNEIQRVGKTMAGTKREKSINEMRVITKVKLDVFYNDFILPLSPKFQPMASEKSNSLCPFHEDTDPSLYSWGDKHIYHCFGCGYTGDVVSAYQLLSHKYYGKHTDLETTIHFLANKYGIELDAEDGFKVKSIFDVARDSLINQDTYKVPVTKMTLAEYDKNNRKVINSNYALSTKINTFALMDVVASIEQKERD